MWEKLFQVTIARRRNKFSFTRKNIIAKVSRTSCPRYYNLCDLMILPFQSHGVALYQDLFRSIRKQFHWVLILRQKLSWPHWFLPFLVFAPSWLVDEEKDSKKKLFEEFSFAECLCINGETSEGTMMIKMVKNVKWKERFRRRFHNWSKAKNTKILLRYLLSGVAFSS